MKEYDKHGILSLEDLNLPTEKHFKKGVAITECVQRIPCNPCVDVCPVNAIEMKDINDPPVVDFDKCIGCGKCVGVCPGLAIFVIKKVDDRALITLPYEFLPVPEKNDKVDVLDREGKTVGKGFVKKVVRQGKTFVITVEVDEKFAMDVRNIKI